VARSKEYIRLAHNYYISWKAFDKITEQMQGKSEEEGAVIENSPAFLKALKRWQKWDKAYRDLIDKEDKEREQFRLNKPN